MAGRRYCVVVIFWFFLWNKFSCMSMTWSVHVFFVYFSNMRALLDIEQQQQAVNRPAEITTVDRPVDSGDSRRSQLEFYGFTIIGLFIPCYVLCPLAAIWCYDQAPSNPLWTFVTLYPIIAFPILYHLYHKSIFTTYIGFITIFIPCESTYVSYHQDRIHDSDLLMATWLCTSVVVLFVCLIILLIQCLFRIFN